MSTDLPLPEMRSAEVRLHPDALLLSRVRRALDWWEEQPVDHPTSSITGGGAVEELERRLAEVHDRPYAVAVPSATLGLRLALQAVGVRPGDDVLVPGVDWTATAEAVRSLGARAVPVPVHEADLTIDAVQAAVLRTPRATAVVVCHLHGLVGDVALLRELTGLPVVEDVAAALGSTRDGALAGTTGDAAVLSLGPGKRLDAGEGSVLLTSDRRLRDRAIGLSAHPIRLRLQRVAPQADRLSLRLHPLAAVVGLHRLTGWDADRDRLRWQAAAAEAAGHAGVRRVLGTSNQRSAGSVVAVMTNGDAAAPGSPSGASVLDPSCGEVVAGIRLVPVDTGIGVVA